MHYLHSTRLIKHGLAAMLVSLLGGFVLLFSMIGAISLSPLPVFIDVAVPGTPQGWRIVHLGMMMNGLMAILLGACLRWFSLRGSDAAWVCWGTIVAVWGNFCFYLFGMFAPNHGLTLQANRLGEASLAGAVAFFPALLGAVTLSVAVVLLLRAKPLD
ncbi:hypothetical protein D0B54_18390 [Solimonas sp. K1W22B-7]|uniref:hypothetical protein n=1 Tax=Solimonas sp. K1W22B-7 TaxID=2303331 RepID=UPI000E334984|nr:hypothetical protein [Solimonas sp. K1W22B-7]AXQ30529.1 hypothetical protein D0B54_18390 [Solimonas sp. K1W22B-7]